MEAHRGTLILVFGILSIVICGIFGPFAWKMGQGDLAKIDAGTMDPEGRQLTNAGKICGIVGSIFLVLQVIYIIVMVAVVGIGAASGGF